MAESTSILQILVKVRDEAAAALSRLSNEVQDVGGSMSFLSDKAGMAAGAIAAIGGLTIGLAIKEAREAAIEWKKTEIVLKGLGVSLDDMKKRAEEMAATSTFQAHQIGLAYAKNISLFGDTKEALEKTKLAMDLAAISGMDLGQVQRIISKASDENLMALRRLADIVGLKLPESTLEGIDKTEQFNLILGKLAERVHGADQAMLEADGWLQLKKATQDLLQVIGEVLLPILNKLIRDYVLPLIQLIKKWAEAHPELFQNIVLATAAFVGLMAILAPILLILPTLITLFKIGAVVIGAISAPIWVVFAALAALAIAVYVTRDAWKNAWDNIKWALEPVYNTIMGWLRSLLDMLNSVLSAISRVSSSVGGALSRAGSFIGGIWPFQHGGIVTRPTIGLLGEAGAEAVIPLSRLGGAGIGGATIVVNFSGDIYSTREIAEKLASDFARNIKYQLKL